MKFTQSFLALAITGLALTSCKQAESSPKEETAVVASSEKLAAVKPETASFSIEGMTCSMGCAKTIEKELSQMDGVQKASVDFEKKTATVNFDATKQTPESLVKVVEATADGKTYKVSNVTTSANQAMVYPQEQEKEKKASKKKKGSTEATTTEAKDAKPACCSSKKKCSSEEGKA